LIGKHNALNPVNECGKPLIEVSVNVFAAPLVKLPGGMFKVSLELVELAPALAHLHLKCTSGDGNKETEHHSNDLRDCRDHAMGSGSYNYQRRDGRGADHHEPAGEVKRLLRPAAHTVGYQYTLAPLEAQVVLSFGMIRPLIDQRRRQPVDPAPPRAATPLLPSAKEPITHAHSMTYPRPGTRRQRPAGTASGAKRPRLRVPASAGGECMVEQFLAAVCLLGRDSGCPASWNPSPRGTLVRASAPPAAHRIPGPFAAASSGCGLPSPPALRQAYPLAVGSG
jgi:hypothetical protein